MKALRLLLGLAILWASPVFAAQITFFANLTGPGESPPNTSTGTGFADVIFDSTAETLRVIVSFSGLTTGTTASHIHCCVLPPDAVGVATTVPTFPGFPLGVTSGTYDQTFNLLLPDTYNPAFVTANGGTVASAEAALTAGLLSGTTYLNIHTTQFPGGEIRGFLEPVPEPATMLLAGFALTGLVLQHRLRRRS